MIDKKLLHRLGGNPDLVLRVRAAIAEGRPLWTEGISDDLPMVMDCLSIIAMRDQQRAAAQHIIAGDTSLGPKLGLFDAFTEEYLIDQEKPR